ncbi:MAG: hypothetical protein LBK18_08835 [Prevotellaceae bacterium]|jgi:hypothetical protein|nr:hypothetical protein [Prevotellaceae bacterium]
MASYNLSYNDIFSLMAASAEHAVKAYRIERGEEPAFLSEREAAQKYGWAAVRRWIREGKIDAHKEGDRNHKLNLDAQKLKEIATTEKAAALLCYQANVSATVN